MDRVQYVHKLILIKIKKDNEKSILIPMIRHPKLQVQIQITVIDSLVRMLKCAI